MLKRIIAYETKLFIQPRPHFSSIRVHVPISATTGTGIYYQWPEVIAAVILLRPRKKRNLFPSHILFSVISRSPNLLSVAIYHTEGPFEVPPTCLPCGYQIRRVRRATSSLSPVQPLFPTVRLSPCVPHDSTFPWELYANIHTEVGVAFCSGGKLVPPLLPVQTDL